MSSPQYDIVTVGGGLAGAALAKSMADRGARVLVLEREVRFKDRVRGEYFTPWGAAEAQKLGILDLLLERCAHQVPLIEMGMGQRDLCTTTPQSLPGVTFAHPEMQEVLLAAAQAAGAEVRRGVTVDRIERGSPARVILQNGGGAIAARLVVAADGRGSPSRKQLNFTVKEAPVGNFFAGVLLTDLKVPEDLSYFIFNSEIGTVFGFIPIGKNRFRTYFGYPKSSIARLQGEAMVPQFLAEVGKTFPAAPQMLNGARAIGPLASFDVSESWVDHPYDDGVALVGDSAGTSDPSFGQGLNLTLRDVRVLCDELCKTQDWEAAGHHYADQHSQFFLTCHKVEGWLRQLFQDPSLAAAELRQRAMPLIGEDPTRVPDHLFSGPDLPADEAVRARLFGEC